MPRVLPRAIALAIAALSVAACNDSTSPLNVSAAQLEAMGSSIAAEIEGGVTQLTAQGVMSTNGGGGGSFSRLPYFSRLPRSGTSFSRYAAGAMVDPCGVPSEDPPTDSDADQVPDNLTVTFALPACHYSDLASGTSFDLTGVLRVSDPQPATAGMALDFSLNNLRIDISSPDGSGYVLRDGVASVLVSETGLSQLVDWTESAQMSGVPSVGLDINWMATFAAAQGQSILAGQPLPDGTYAPNGSVDYREGNRTASFSVTTLEPLVYSAACAAGTAPDGGTAFSPFTAGRVRVAITSGEGAGSVEVTYVGCNMANLVVSGR